VDASNQSAQHITPNEGLIPRLPTDLDCLVENMRERVVGQASSHRSEPTMAVATDVVRSRSGPSGAPPSLSRMYPVVATAFPEWLTAIGGVGAFAATARLAYLAKEQMDATSRQADEEAKRLDKQVTASLEQGEAIRESARAQLQPMVFAHADAVRTCPNAAGGERDNEYMLGSGQVGFGYKLANEGTGLGLNIRHGVAIEDKRWEFGEGMRWRALRPGEQQPAADFLDQGVWIRIKPLVVVCDERELPSDWAMRPRYYWTEFENVFGERFGTRNPSDPAQPAGFVRLGGAGPS
jgi:hypothetical protein